VSIGNICPHFKPKVNRYFSTNEGFQEVTSKKAQKLKQKAQQEAELKKQILTEKQKKEAHNKVSLI
jgi:hypothetical protein